MTAMTPVPSVLLDQLRTTLPHDSDAGFFLSDIIDAARAVLDAALQLTDGCPCGRSDEHGPHLDPLDAVQPTAEDEPARITNADMLIEYLTDDEREMLRPWAARTSGRGTLFEAVESILDAHSRRSPAVCPTEAEDTGKEWISTDSEAMKERLAEAWDEGNATGDDGCAHDNYCSWETAVNPYRPPAPSVPTTQELAEQAWQVWNWESTPVRGWRDNGSRHECFIAAYLAAVAGDAREQENWG